MGEIYVFNLQDLSPSASSPSMPGSTIVPSGFSGFIMPTRTSIWSLLTSVKTSLAPTNSWSLAPRLNCALSQRQNQNPTRKKMQKMRKRSKWSHKSLVIVGANKMVMMPKVKGRLLPRIAPSLLARVLHPSLHFRVPNKKTASQKFLSADTRMQLCSRITTSCILALSSSPPPDLGRSMPKATKSSLMIARFLLAMVTMMSISRNTLFILAWKTQLAQSKRDLAP